MTTFQMKPTTNALQRIMGSFKQFEKKLDKLQDDVSNHGQTLNQLHVLVSHLSNLTNSEPASETGKRNAADAVKHTSDVNKHASDMVKHTNSNVVKKPVTTAIATQHEQRDEPVRARRPQALQPLTTNIKTRSVPMMQREVLKKRMPGHRMPTIKAGQEKLTHKANRHSKAEAPRKATTLRTQKATLKKTSKMAH